jgi:hypothetical protein
MTTTSAKNFAKKIKWTMVLVFGFMSIAAGAHADSITFSDGTFNTADWALQTIVISGNSPTMVSATQQTTGGNPGDFRQIEHSFTGPTHFASISLYEVSTYNPSVSGAITSVNFSEDAISIESYQSTGIVLQQGGNYYFDYLIDVNNTVWQTLSKTGLVATDFKTTTGQTPDFSIGGGPITFGFYEANSVTDSNSYDTKVGIDNLKVTLNYTPVPLPSSFLLFGTGLFLLTKWQRNRKSS